MALEDLTGSKCIDALVTTNPDGATDPKSQGDDHIRGIKNTLRNTFPNLTGPVTADQSELNILDGCTRTAAQLNAIYYAGGGDVAIADGGTGASDAGSARANLGLGSLATRNSVGSGQIDDGSVGTAELANSAVTDAKITKSTSYGSYNLGIGSVWVPPVGVYVFAPQTDGTNTGSPLLQVYSGSSWVGGSPLSGTVITDGANVRVLNTDNSYSTVIYYRKLA